MTGTSRTWGRGCGRRGNRLHAHQRSGRRLRRKLRKSNPLSARDDCRSAGGVASDLPVFVHISSTDWVEGGWTLEDSIALCRVLKAKGNVDLIDCASGGNDLRQKIPRTDDGCGWLDSQSGSG